MALSVINSNPGMGLGGASYNSANFLQPASYPSTTTGSPSYPTQDYSSAPAAPGYVTGGYSPTYAAAPIYSAPAPPPIDYAAIAQFDQQIGNVNAGIGRLPNQLNIGNQNLQDAYNSSLNSLLQDKANANQQYQTGKTQDSQQYVGAKNTIGQNAGNSLNGLERLLGMHGAGGSSAALYSGPQAVAQLASQQRSGAGQTFGANEQGLDTTWNNYLLGEQKNEKSLGDQLTNQKNSLQSQIDSTRANLLQSLASLQGQRASAAHGNPTSAAQPYLDQANSYLSQADNLGAQVPVYQTTPVTYQAPSAQSYTVNPFAPPTAQGQGISEGVSPSLSFLLNNGQKQQNPLSAQQTTPVTA